MEFEVNLRSCRHTFACAICEFGDRQSRRPPAEHHTVAGAVVSAAARFGAHNDMMQHPAITGLYVKAGEPHLVGHWQVEPDVPVIQNSISPVKNSTTAFPSARRSS